MRIAYKTFILSLCVYICSQSHVWAQDVTLYRILFQVSNEADMNFKDVKKIGEVSVEESKSGHYLYYVGVFNDQMTADNALHDLHSAGYRVAEIEKINSINPGTSITQNTTTSSSPVTTKPETPEINTSKPENQSQVSTNPAPSTQISGSSNNNPTLSGTSQKLFRILFTVANNSDMPYDNITEYGDVSIEKSKSGHYLYYIGNFDRETLDVVYVKLQERGYKVAEIEDVKMVDGMVAAKPASTSTPTRPSVDTSLASERAAREREAEEKRRLEEEVNRKAMAEQKRMEAEANRKAEEEAKRIALEKQRQIEEEAQRKALEEKRKMDEEVQRKALEEQKRMEEEAKLKAAEEMRREEERKQAAEEEKRRLEEEVRKQAMEQENKRLEEEAKRKAMEEADQKKALEDKLREEERVKQETDVVAQNTNSSISNTMNQYRILFTVANAGDLNTSNINKLGRVTVEQSKSGHYLYYIGDYSESEVENVITKIKAKGYKAAEVEKVKGAVSNAMPTYNGLNKDSDLVEAKEKDRVENERIQALEEKRKMENEAANKKAIEEETRRAKEMKREEEKRQAEEIKKKEEERKKTMEADKIRLEEEMQKQADLEQKRIASEQKAMAEKVRAEEAMKEQAETVTDNTTNTIPTSASSTGTINNVYRILFTVANSGDLNTKDIQRIGNVTVDQSKSGHYLYYVGNYAESEVDVVLAKIKSKGYQAAEIEKIESSMPSTHQADGKNRTEVNATNLEAERAMKEKMEAEKAMKEKLAMEKAKQEQESLHREKIEKAKLEQERSDRERMEKDKIERERLEREKAEKARLEKEKLEAEMKAATAKAKDEQLSKEAEKAMPSNSIPDTNNADPVKTAPPMTEQEMPSSSNYKILFTVTNQSDLSFKKVERLGTVSMDQSRSGHYRYYVGDFDSEANAENALQNLKKQGYGAAEIVKGTSLPAKNKIITPSKGETKTDISPPPSSTVQKVVTTKTKEPRKESRNKTKNTQSSTRTNTKDTANGEIADVVIREDESYHVLFRVLKDPNMKFPQLEGIGPIFKETFSWNGSTRYLAGDYQTEADARNMLNLVKERGFELSFVVKYSKGRFMKVVK